jgi:hypothetical protein
VNSAQSSFDIRRSKAIALLKKTGIWKINYLPPAITLLWRMGVKVPPPHFAGFAITATMLGLYFGLAWGVIMWLFVWSSQGMSSSAALFKALSTGVLFGLAMAAYYAYGRKKHQLPSWDSLLDAQDAI